MNIILSITFMTLNLSRRAAPLSALLLLGLWSACNSASPQQERVNLNASSPTPAQQPTATPVTMLKEDAPSLCARLGDLKKIPSRDPNDSDPIYDALLKHGNDAIPCLIDKITDTTPMKDPREAPSVGSYKVGDTAVFILLDITMGTEYEAPHNGMLPLEYENKWKTDGVYAYFRYVESPDNRKRLQAWWKAWRAKHSDKKQGLTKD